MSFNNATPAQVDETRNSAMLVERDNLSRLAMYVVSYEEANKNRSGVDYAKGAAKRGMTPADLLGRADDFAAEWEAGIAAEQVRADARAEEGGYEGYTVRDAKFTPSYWEHIEDRNGRAPTTRASEEQAEKIAGLALVIREAQATIAECDAEYERRGGWARYWIVVSSTGGKVHRYGCGSWRWTTQVALAFEVSGNDDEGVVHTLGADACTRCFPDAPLAPEASEETEEETEEAPAPEGEVTPEMAAEELARRAHNRKARKDDSIERRQAASEEAFAMSAAELKAIAEG